MKTRSDGALQSGDLFATSPLHTRALRVRGESALAVAFVGEIGDGGGGQRSANGRTTSVVQQSGYRPQREPKFSLVVPVETNPQGP